MPRGASNHTMSNKVISNKVQFHDQAQESLPGKPTELSDDMVPGGLGADAQLMST